MSALTVAVIGIVGLSAGAAHADAIAAPIDLGTAAPFSVLASSTVTNTGPSVLNGDVGLSPGTSITGFPPGIVNGTRHATDAVAAQAQLDLTTAIGEASGLTPNATGLGDLTGSSLTPGVYSGGELSVTGALTLAGTAESVWVFQAASTLTIGSSAVITVTGGANACNVYWQVGSSATLNPGARFVGTVLANESITAGTGATITGRLLASNGAVTLDNNRIRTSTGCEPGAVDISPVVTSTTPPDGAVGVEYSHTITASGIPTPTFTITDGELPPGVQLDETTGVLAGSPTASGSYTFDVTVTNGTGVDDVETYTVTVAPAAAVPVVPVAGEELAVTDAAVAASLAESGPEIGWTLIATGMSLSLGLILLLIARLRERAVSAASRRISG